MIKISDPKLLTNKINELKRQGRQISFVPTMGALHDGHLSLVKIAKQHGNICVMSIFVNPLQFNNKEDLLKYPRTIDRDCELASSSGVDIMFMPDSSDIYPTLQSGENQAPKNCTLRAGSCSTPLEGPFRPGHFDGVVTVVSILFHIVQPDTAIFGEKDFQQVKVIEQMVKDLHFPINIISAPTIREKDGLAMSSRNMRLNSEQRTRALTIAKALYHAKKLVDTGVTDVARIEAESANLMSAEGALKVEYCSIVDRLSLTHLAKITQSCQMVIAAWCDNIRLIDNLEVSAKIE